MVLTVSNSTSYMLIFMYIHIRIAQMHALKADFRIRDGKAKFVVPYAALGRAGYQEPLEAVRPGP